MIFIRADANARVGAGHVMRCLSIARAIREEVLFATADHQGAALIRDFPSVCLDTDWRDMESELVRFQSLIGKHQPRLILVDSYRVTQRWFHAVRQTAPVAYMDDLGAERWDVDWLINYNIYAETLDYPGLYAGARTELLIGTDYVPMRNEFRNLPGHDIRERVSDVLVSAGGADPERVTERLIGTVCPRFRDVRFHFVIGALNPRIDAIRGLAGGNVVLHIDERDMSGLMRRCDAAVAAAGTTLYELCACGLPTITYVLADNQIQGAKRFEARGVMLNAGDCRQDDGFCLRVEKLLGSLDMARRCDLSKRMQRLVDGNGATRIAERLMV